MSNSTHLPDDELPTILTGALIEALGQVGAALAIVDRSGEVIHQNDRMRELSRHGHGPRMPEELLTRVLEDGETITDAEFALARLEGLPAPMRWSSWPVHDAGGRIVGAAMLAVDLVAQTSAGERLAYFDELLKGSDDAIVGTDADFRVTIWSAGAEKLYGYTADEALGRMAREIASYEGDPSRTRLEPELADTGKSRIELTAGCRGGQSVEVGMTATAVRDAAGEVVGYLGSHRDISARKRAEREQERLVAIARNSKDFIGIADLDGIPQFVNAAGRRLVGVGDSAIEETQVPDWFVPEDRDYVRDVVVPLLLERGRWPAESELR